jgi:excisionase family DNA binding protein
VPLSEDLLEALSVRVAELILERIQTDLAPTSNRWMRTKEAAEYLGWTRSALYTQVSQRSIPHYKIERTLLFKREDLDAWMAEHRVESRGEISLTRPRELTRSRSARSRSEKPKPDEAPRRNASAPAPSSAADARRPDGVCGTL